MDLGKFNVLVEIYERKKAIIERHNNFSSIRDIMSNNPFIIENRVEEIAHFLNCKDNDFKIIFIDYFMEMIHKEDEDFVKQYEQIEKEIKEA